MWCTTRYNKKMLKGKSKPCVVYVEFCIFLHDIIFFIYKRFILDIVSSAFRTLSLLSFFHFGGEIFFIINPDKLSTFMKVVILIWTLIITNLLANLDQWQI